MQNFTDRLIEAIIEKRSPCVVGLDTMPEYMPGYATENVNMPGRTEISAQEAVLAYNKAVIDAVCDIVPAVKPQLAYYERLGRRGLDCFWDTVAYAQSRGLIVIADAKRGDIGTTAEAYAEAFFGQNNQIADSDDSGSRVETRESVDALTVNPYMGEDSVEPFLKRCAADGKGVFALVKTSNPSSADIQDLNLDGGQKVYDRAAAYVEKWGSASVGRYGYSAVGAVVGATFPAQTRALRLAMPRAYILAPGYGAQGGGAADVAAAFDPSGLGAIVNASRSVLLAWKHARWEGKYAQTDFADAARAETLRMRKEINEAIGAIA